jgi:hypothetical protein
MGTFRFAPQVLLRLNITPDKWFKKWEEMSGFDGKEGAKREQHISCTPMQNEKIVKLDAPDIQLRASELLNKAFYGNNRDDDGLDGGPGPGGVVINLGFLEPKRAEAILAKLTRHRADRSAASLQEGTIDVAPGE